MDQILHASPGRSGELNSQPGRASANPSWQTWLLPAFVLACWLLAIRHLSAEWTLNEQYHFGWLVPFLAAYLVKVRLEEYPTPRPTPSALQLGALLLTLAICSALLMPVREANLDWRMIEWMLVALASAASFACAWHCGGARWVRHFAFPILFFLIAVPLPRRLEAPWMDWLMRHNATIAVEALRWFGIDGQARGNLIQLPECTLGIDEACSGIRSLQGTLMLTLFMGEILGLRWSRRFALLAAGTFYALLMNVTRTVALGVAASREGPSALDRWHDPAGFTALAITSTLVILTAWLLQRSESSPGGVPVAAPVNLAGLQPRLGTAAIPAALALAVVIAGLIGTDLWFRHRAASLIVMPAWTFELPSTQTAFKETPLSPRVRNTLHFDEGYSGQWEDGGGNRWQAFYFQWLAGRNATQTESGHDPRSCLSGTGMREASPRRQMTFERGNVRLAFDAFHFRDGPEDVFIFNCLAEDVRAPDEVGRTRSATSLGERLKAAMAGRRQAGQRRLEVAVWGIGDADEAMARFRRLLEDQMAIQEPLAKNQ